MSFLLGIDFGTSYFKVGLFDAMSATHRTLLLRLRAARPATKIIATGGGARSDEWLQINADMLGATIVAPRCHERACLGAAAFAAVAAERFALLPEALSTMVHSDRVADPRVEAVSAYHGEGSVN